VYGGHALFLQQKNADVAATEQAGGRGHDMKIELQGAIVKLQNAFDTRKSDFLERLLAQEDTRLAHFVPADDEILSSIEEDLAHFRRTIEGGTLDETEDDTMAAATMALPLLKSAIDKLHLALNHHNDEQQESQSRMEEDGPADASSAQEDEMSTTMIEQTIVDLAAAIDTGDDDDMEAFIASHTAILKALLKTSIAVLHDALLLDNENQESSSPSDILQRLLLLDGDLSITTAVTGGAVVSEDTKSMIASILGGSEVAGQQIPLPILQIIQIVIEVLQVLQCGLAVALRYVLIIPYIVFPFFIPIPIFFTCMIWRPNELKCPAAVIKELFFFNPLAIYDNCQDSLPSIPIPGA
jgi:hypothetical protein